MNELQVNADPGLWVYVQIERASDGHLWNPTLGTPAFEAEQAAGAGWIEYSIQVPETAAGVTGRYRGNMPAGIGLGDYILNYYIATVPGSPALGDAQVAASVCSYDGAQAVDAARALCLIRAHAAGKIVISGDTETLYDLDGTTVRAVMPLIPGGGGPYTERDAS